MHMAFVNCIKTEIHQPGLNLYKDFTKKTVGVFYLVTHWMHLIQYFYDKDGVRTELIQLAYMLGEYILF